MRAIWMGIVLACASGCAFAQIDAVSDRLSLEAEVRSQKAKIHEQEQKIHDLQNEIESHKLPPNTLTSVPLAITAAPRASVPTGILEEGATVTLQSASHYATIYYTLDGWRPTVNSARYTGPIHIGHSTHLQAIAIAPSSLESTVTHAYYKVTRPTPDAPRSTVVETDGTLHAGTRLRLVVQDDATSGGSQVGDTVRMVLDVDVKKGNAVLISRGTPVRGVLVNVDPASAAQPGDLVLEVTQISANGKTIPLTARESVEVEWARREEQEALIEPGMTVDAVVATETPLDR